jgi:iron(III) transport system ATP-binding protein
LEQFDTPETIYHTPSTPFVADFVGQADFVPGVVQNGKVSTEIGEFPNLERYPIGAWVVVMIRPDDIHVVPSEDGTARLLARQFRGSENLYTVALPSGRLVHSSEPSTSVFPVGTPVHLRVNATHTVLFPQSARDTATHRAS